MKALYGLAPLVMVIVSVSSGKGMTALHTTAILGLALMILATGLTAGCLLCFMRGMSKRSDERLKTYELIRQYIEMKMKDEAI